MIRNTFLASVMLAFYLSSAVAQNEWFSFDNPEFFVRQILIEPSVEPRISRDSFLWNFRTRIREAARGNRPNFAGRYIVTQWGCGTGCQAGAIINTVTGEVYPGPLSSLGIDFRPYSALLVVNPPDEEPDPYRPDWVTTEYYLWTGSEFLDLN